jgi:hypothetical protein
MSDEPKMVPIPKGALFTVITGEYSDYYVRGVFRAKEDIDAETLRGRWLIAHPEQRKDYNFEEDEFLAWAASLGLMEPLDCYEWHLADYGCVNTMTVAQIANDCTPQD